MIERHFRFIVGNDDPADIALGKRRKIDRLARGFFVNPDFCARVLVRRYHAILSVARERDEQNVPRRFLNHFAFAVIQVVARDVEELAAFIRQEIKIFRRHIELLRIVPDVPCVRRNVLHLFRFRVVEINIGIRRGLTRLFERDEFPVVRDIAELVACLVLVNQLGRKIGNRHFENVEKLWVA